jgi:hypothetical protein
MYPRMIDYPENACYNIVEEGNRPPRIKEKRMLIRRYKNIL